MNCSFFTMLASRIILSAYLKNGLAYRVGRRALTSETHSDFSSDLVSSRGRMLIQVAYVYRDKQGNLELTKEAQKLDTKVDQKLSKCLKKLKTPDFKLGDALVIPDLMVDKIPAPAIAVTCIGPKDAKLNPAEGLDERKENVRYGVGAAYKAMSLYSIADTPVRCEGTEGIWDAVCSSQELSKYTFTYWSTTDGQGRPATDGEVFGKGQNWARHLSQMPTKNMTPDGVVKEVKIKLAEPGVTVTSYDKKAIEKKNMHAFLAVAQGSSTAPMLLECDYKGKAGGAPYLLMVAKGVTFDSGGLCLKKRDDMLMNSGMTGAAAALGALLAVATLKVAVNVRLVVPLCENMISGQCLKVGDVVPTLKGDEVKIEDTDLEGHLMLADALTYGQTKTTDYMPKYVMSIASLTPGIKEATGGGCYGCFTKSDDLWKIAHNAGVRTGDRPWRFPIWNYYSREITGDTPVFNWKNRGSGIASHCTGATFLDKFVTCDNWLHYDITGVGKMAADQAPPYLDPNLMTGRPTRALIRTIIDLADKMKAPTDGNEEKKP